MNKKQEALTELNIASTLSPPFDEEFIIYRYRKLAEEYGDNGISGNNEDRNKGKGNIDVMTRFAYENNFRQLQIHIERCA